MASPPPKQSPPPNQSASAAILAAPVPPFSAGGTTDFVGFPANTSDPTAILAADKAAQVQWAQGAPAPAYANGAQNLPVLQGWAPSDIDTLQRRLVNSGLLDTDYRSGVWDKPSQAAFEQVLGLANNMGHPWQDALATYESSTPMQWDAKTGTYVKGTAGTARTKAPVVANFTNPDDLALTAQGVATAKLGRSFTPQELQRFIAAYHGTEQAAAQGASDAGGPGGGGYTSPASATAAATTFAQQADPTAYNGEQFLPLVQKMNDLLSGPNLQTTKPMQA